MCRLSRAQRRQEYQRIQGLLTGIQSLSDKVGFTSGNLPRLLASAPIKAAENIFFTSLKTNSAGVIHDY